MNWGIEGVNELIRLRAHHGMCLSYFKGSGYSEGFTAHMAQIKRRLEENPTQTISVCIEPDDICVKCPNLQTGDVCVCEAQEKVGRYDKGVIEALGIALSEGEELKITYCEFSKAVREKILDVGLRRKICGDCEWNELCM